MSFVMLEAGAVCERAYRSRVQGSSVAFTIPSRRRASGIILVLCFLVADVLCAARASGERRLGSDLSVSAMPGAAVVRCPFNFQEGMSPGVFCVYEGLARGSDGRACGDRMIVIWTRLAPEFGVDGQLDADVIDRSNVYFGFVMSSDLVMRAGVDDSAEGRATIIDYTQGHDQPRVRLRGTAQMRFAPAAGGEGAEVLGLRIRGPVLASATCVFTSYDGTFAGVMTLPPDATP